MTAMHEQMETAG